jgi:ADP-ribose pyrophosphatase YjhB (NUDIX family)
MPLHLVHSGDGLGKLRSRLERAGGRVVEPGADPAATLSAAGLSPDETFWVLPDPSVLPSARASRIRACAIEPDPGRNEAWEGCDEIWRSEEEAVRWLERQLQLETCAWPVATVGGLVFRDDGKALFVRTAKWSGTWGVPGGKIDYGESSEDAFRREIREETGLEVSDVRLVLVHDAIEEPEFHRPRHFVLLNYSARARTETVRLNHESLEWGWFGLEEAAGLSLNRPTRALVETLRSRDLESGEQGPRGAPGGAFGLPGRFPRANGGEAG